MKFLIYRTSQEKYSYEDDFIPKQPTDGAIWDESEAPAEWWWRMEQLGEWTINIDTLEELVELRKRVGELVISTSELGVSVGTLGGNRTAYVWDSL